MDCFMSDYNNCPVSVIVVWSSRSVVLSEDYKKADHMAERSTRPQHRNSVP